MLYITTDKLKASTHFSKILCPLARAAAITVGLEVMTGEGEVLSEYVCVGTKCPLLRDVQAPSGDGSPKHYCGMGGAAT